MMHMYGLNSFEGDNSFVQAQGFAFQQRQNWNWNLYNQLTIDPFMTDNTINVLPQLDQYFPQYNFQQNHEINNKKKKSNHIYSKYTIPSITSIISQQQQQQITTNNVNTMNFLQSNNIFPPPPIISSIPSKPSIDSNFNYNENSNLLTQSQPQSSTTTQPSDTLSYFTTPDKGTTITIQEIIDGMKVMQEISNDLTTYNSDLLQDVTNNLATNFDENSIDWLIQDNWEGKTYESKGKLPEKNQEDIFYQDVGDLIEEHMKEVKKVVHNEILCQEILTESSLEYQDLSFNNLMFGTGQTEDGSLSSTTTTAAAVATISTAAAAAAAAATTTTATTTIPYQDDVIIKQGVINQENVLGGSSSSSPSSNMFVPQENSFSYGTLTNSTNLTKSRGYTADQRTLKCDEIGCSREYNCYAKLKSHKATHTNDKTFICNVLGCNKKYKRSGELIKHQLDHLGTSYSA